MDITKLIELRKELHAQPEISGQESNTSRRIAEFLSTCHPDETISGLGGFGVLATWNSGADGPWILFRCELDALPIKETNDIPHASQREGWSHACGHDGHMAVLCGLALGLYEKGLNKGRVSLLFQPSEENGEGAKAVLQDPKFARVNPDYVFALHNIPGYPLHSVIVRENSFTAAVSSLMIHLKGKTSHAAEPEHGINPALAVSEILQECLALAVEEPSKKDMKIITPVYLLLGEKAYGTSAGEAEVHFTLRCWDNDHLKLLEEEIEGLVSEVASRHRLEKRFGYTQRFFANENDELAVRLVRTVADRNGLELREREHPFKWGEDFGLFTSRFRGCLFGVGAGEASPAIHNPDYDFPDELIQSGVSIFSGIIDQIHQEYV